MSAQSTTEVYSSAADRLRDTLKWFLTSLAAVGAVLIAGLSLSNVGEATGPRLVAVVVGFAVALAAVLGAAIVCAIVLGVRTDLSIYNLPDKPDVTGDISKDTALMKAIGADGVTGLGGRLTEAVEKQLSAFKSHRANPQDAEKRAAYEAVDAEVTRLNEVAGTVVSIAAYKYARRRFIIASSAVAVLSVVAGIGIFIFAWGANPPDDTVAHIPTVVETPTDVEVMLDEDGRDRLQEQLGAACVTGVIPAVVLEDRGGGRYLVAIAGTDECTAALVDVGPDDGAVALPQG